MICIAEYEFSAKLDKISRAHGLYSCLRANWCKNGCGDDSIGGGETAGPSTSVSRQQLKFKHGGYYRTSGNRKKTVFLYDRCSSDLLLTGMCPIALVRSITRPIKSAAHPEPIQNLTSCLWFDTMLAKLNTITLFIQRGGGTDPLKPQQPPQCRGDVSGNGANFGRCVSPQIG